MHAGHLPLAVLALTLAGAPAYASAAAPDLVTIDGHVPAPGFRVELRIDPVKHTVNHAAVEYTCTGKAPRADADLRTATAGGSGTKALVKLGTAGRGAATFTAQTSRGGESAHPITLKPAKVELFVKTTTSGGKLVVTGSYHVTQSRCTPPPLRFKASGPSAVPCPSQPSELIRDDSGAVFHDATQLKSCTIAYGLPARTETLGPWADGTKAAWDGTEVAWTVPDAAAPGTDRVWAASAGTGEQWLSGVQATPSAPGAVVGLKVFGESAGWATAAKDAVVAVRFPKGPPTITGDGAAPAGSIADGATYGVVGSFPKAKDVLRLVPDLGLDSSIDQPTCAAGRTFRATVATASAGAVDVRWPTTQGQDCPPLT